MMHTLNIPAGIAAHLVQHCKPAVISPVLSHLLHRMAQAGGVDAKDDSTILTFTVPTMTLVEIDKAMDNAPMLYPMSHEYVKSVVYYIRKAYDTPA